MHARISLARRMPDCSASATICRRTIRRMHSAKASARRISMVRRNCVIGEDHRRRCFSLATAYDEDEEIFLDSTGCNKMIMIVTDGATETALNVFQTRNWHPNNVSTCHASEVSRGHADSRFDGKFILDESVYLHDWTRTGRPEAYQMDVLCE